MAHGGVRGSRQAWAYYVRLALATLLLCAWSAWARKASPLQTVLSRYFSNEELESHMLQFSRRCSSIAKLHELGRTVEGRPILSLELSKAAGRQDGKPHFKYVGNVHGDEPTGRVLTLALAEHICETYGADNTIRRLVEDLHLWLVPSMNPDGFKARTRANRSAALGPAGRFLCRVG